MGMSDPRQAVDALDDVRHQNLILLGGFSLAVNQQLHTLRQRFVALGQPVQTLVNVHLLIVYPQRDSSLGGCFSG